MTPDPESPPPAPSTPSEHRDEGATESSPGPTPAAAPQTNPLLKLAIELGPLLVFFVLNAKMDIYWGTGGFMAAMVVSLAAARVMEGRFPVMPLFTTVFVLVFGSLTIYLEDERFIKLKPTIVNSLFGTILLVGLATGRALLKVVFESAMQLEAEGWRRLTFRWAIFFFVLAGLNEVMWRSFDTDTWVAFKTFGILPLTVIFMLAQAPLLAKYQIEDPASERT